MHDQLTTTEQFDFSVSCNDWMMEYSVGSSPSVVNSRMSVKKGSAKSSYYRGQPGIISRKPQLTKSFWKPTCSITCMARCSASKAKVAARAGSGL
jgi:hypothetical protein